MEELKIRGTVVSVLKEETGVSKAGKEWKKQDFVIETNEQYPKKVAFTTFGDKTDLLMKIGEGMIVDVSFNIESREYNGKYFHNINAWKIIVDTGSATPPSHNMATNESATSFPPTATAPSETGGDLPF